jgi:hypothetical protein
MNRRKLLYKSFKNKPKVMAVLGGVSLNNNLPVGNIFFFLPSVFSQMQLNFSIFCLFSNSNLCEPKKKYNYK